MPSGLVFPPGSRDAPCGSPSSPRFSSGGMDAGLLCVDVTHHTVLAASVGAVMRSCCIHTRGLWGRYLCRCRTAVRLAVLLPPLHGVTLVGGPATALYGCSPGRSGHSRLSTHPTSHHLGILPPLGPQSSSSGTPFTPPLAVTALVVLDSSFTPYPLPLPPYLYPHWFSSTSHNMAVVFLSYLLSPNIVLTHPHYLSLSQVPSVPVPALVGARFRPCGAPRLGSRLGLPGWLTGSRRLSISA